MTYELAKQLKDAGFPSPEEPTIGDYSSWTLQKTHGAAFSSNGQYELRLFPGTTYARELIYIPTLSELIEACGESIDGITKVWKGVRLEGWGAVYVKMFDSFHSVIEGITPEEAVAKLWLAL